MRKKPAAKAKRGKTQGHPPRKHRLKSLDDLRRFLANVLNRLEAGELTDTDAKTRAYVVNIIAGVMKNSDIEVRMTSAQDPPMKLDLKNLTPEEREAIRSITEKLVVAGV